MGQINVEGIGIIKIEGDEPTPEEAAAIEAGFQSEASKKVIDITDIATTTPPSQESSEGRTGLISPEFRGGVREEIEELPTLFQFLTEMAPSMAGAAGGAVVGTAVAGPFGTIPGAIVGSLIMEFAAQETGVAPESDVALALSGAGPVVGKLAGGALKLARRGTGLAVTKLPPAKAALARKTAQETVPEFESLGSKILAEQKGLMTLPAKELYASAKKVGANISPVEFQKVRIAMQDLVTELRVFGAFPEGQQALALIQRAQQTLKVGEQLISPGVSTGISIESLLAAQQMVGLAVAKAVQQGGLRLGASKTVFKELADVLNRVSVGTSKAASGAKIAKAAIARAKLEFSVRDLDRAAARFTKINPGEDTVTINISRLENWLRKVTNSKDAIFDKNFTDALKEPLPAIKQRLLELGKISGSGSPAGPGSIVVRGIGARTGRSLIGTVIGFGAAGGPGAAIGGLAGASLPEMLTAMLMSKAGFAALKKAATIGTSDIPAQRWIAIGQLLTRGSAFRDTEAQAVQTERATRAQSQQKERAARAQAEQEERTLESQGVPAQTAPGEAQAAPLAPEEPQLLQALSEPPSATTPIKTKAGVTLDDLQPEILSAAETAREIYEAEGVELVVTSGTEGKHKKGSLHPNGQAIDLRTRDMPKKSIKKVIAVLKKTLSSDFDVVLEKDHIHIEFDPKL